MTLKFTEMKKAVITLLAFILLPIFSYSTHIVGGELNYIYNGGSNYTIILKLYRDCGPGTAAYPNSVSITVRGNNGATFSPSKDFNMPLASVSNVPSNQPPCAVQPNPSPCVQVGTYTATVNNLPANLGGYHLYYQITARNLSLNNINGSCNCIGESFYAYIPNNSTPGFNNNNAVFNNLPPLFLCLGQPFTFNHSATDANGDSLVYSLYAPYDGDNGTGPLDPTFPANTASFTPVNYFAGFSANNPLGASPFSINAATGLLTGTPNMLGQFVVGVRVREYRNGGYISQTLRDFQFNVINCPTPPPTLAVPNMTLNNGCVRTFTAGGISAASANWTSIFPGATGAYNSYLSCVSGCLANTVTASGTPPPFIDFKICGTSTNCAATNLCDTFRVYFNPTLSVTINPNNPVLCSGQTSTTLTANGSGGTAPYSYLWNNVNPSQNITVGAGVYNVALSDGTGCPPVFKSVTVTSYTTPIVANAGNDITKCIQNPIATINATVSGAGGGLWSGGTGTFSPNNTTLNNLNYIPTPAEIATGSVSLILTTTANGSCPADKDTVNIFFVGFTGTLTASSSPVICFGGNNGSATVGVSGGFAPHQYTWTTVPVQTTPVAGNLSPGIYSVTIQNSIGCTSATTVSITQPLPLAVNSTVTNVSCFGASNGSITISGTGGSGLYNYTWTPGNLNTASLTNVAAGNYTLLTKDAKGCQLTTTLTITQPASITISASSTNVSCYNANNGIITTTITGGTTPYSYSWSPNGAGSQNVNNLAAGNYTFAVTDNKGCVASRTIAITQPSLLALTINKTNETCNYLNNGTASTTVSGGTPGYNYLWTPGNFTTSSIANLASGNYNVSVTDAKGCITSSLITITQPAALTSGVINKINVSCFGGSNGAVTANPVGGTPAYNYIWTPGSFTTASISNLASGNYTLTVTDSKLCVYTLTTSITQPALLNVTTNYTNVICNASSNGAISISANGGVSPYTHTLMPGNIVASNFSNLASGNYTIITSDANNCVTSNSINLSQPANFSSLTSFTNSTCNMNNGAAAIAITSGGAPPFTFSWSPSGGNNATATSLSAGSYTVNVLDNNGCPSDHIVNINDSDGPGVDILATTNVSCYNGSDGTALATFTGGNGPSFTYSWSPFGGNSFFATNLTTGVYIISVTDNNGCIGLATTSLISQPSQLLVSATATNVTCNGFSDGGADVQANGGTPGYTYNWMPGNFGGNNVSGLAPNIYTVQLTDNNNCITSTTVQITEPTALAIQSINVSDVKCFGDNTGSATVTANGGTPNYIFDWLPQISNSTFAANLIAGTYSVSITDANGCNTFTTITVNQPAMALTATSITNSVSCFGAANGSVSLNVTGGTAGYSYTWTPNVSTANSATGLNPGTYSVNINDINNCKTDIAFTITEPPALGGSLVKTDPSCGLANGSVVSQVNGGIGPYTYFWTPTSSTSTSINGLLPGNFVLQITDAVNCINNYSIALVNISGPTTSISSISNAKCFGGNTGSASVSITQGTLPYSINWFPYGGSSVTGNSLIAGTYTAHVIDALGCVSESTVQINEPTALSISSLSVTNVSCYLGNDGAVQSFVSGGVAAYTYTWLPGGHASAVNNLTAGSYTLMVGDANNCQTAVTAQISQPLALTSTITNVTNALCFNGDGKASISVSGGTLPYSYLWNSSPPQTGNNLLNVISGTYVVNVTDAKGCITVNSVTISQPNKVVTFVSSNDTICQSQSGTLTATANGGAGNYYYSWQPVGVTNNGTLVHSPVTNTVYTVMAFDQNGCAGNSAQSSIIVYHFDKTNLNVTGVSPICPGQVSILGANVIGNTGAVTYTWSNGLANTAGPHIVSPAVNTSYIVSASNACGLIVSDTVLVAINPQPTISITSDTSKICMPGIINFKDFSVVGNPNDPITSWSWDFGGGQVATSQNPSHTFTASGTYSVMLTVLTDAGCTNKNVSTPIIITVHDKPKASFNVNKTTLDLPFDKLICTNTSTGANLFYWNFGDNNFSTEMHPQHLYSVIGDQTVELIATNSFGCSDTAYKKIETNADVIFPNAFTPSIMGTSEGHYNTNSLDNDVFFPYTSGVVEYKLQVFNRWGELIFESDDVAYGWDGRYRGELCQLGVYIWKAHVKLNNGKVYNKVGDVTLIK